MRGTLRRLSRMQGLLQVMAVAYLVPMLLAASLVVAGAPGFRELQAGAEARIVQAEPIATIARLLGERRLLAAIALTFAWNFGVAACLASTAVGVLFPLPPLLGALRGFLIGVVFAGRLRLFSLHGLVMGGTFLLEIGAYILAGALGMRVGLALLPRRGEAPPLRMRLAEPLADLRRLLPVVAFLLLLGAIWENAGLFLLARPP
ncbi:MAG: stage II sporulation protein M [Candidatus Methylomirabilales bacterium]